MTHPSRRVPRRSHGLLGLALCLAAAACAEAPGADAIRALPAEASLDARGLDRRAAAERPATVQRQDLPERGLTLYTAAPRLQTGSAGSLPIIVTSLGAERDRGGAARMRALVVVSNARGYGGFSRAESRQADMIEVQLLGRARECQDPSACLYAETVLLSLPEADLRRAAAAGTPVRIRLNGNASFVETILPVGHLRALADALARPPGA